MRRSKRRELKLVLRIPLFRSSISVKGMTQLRALSNAADFISFIERKILFRREGKRRRQGVFRLGSNGGALLFLFREASFLNGRLRGGLGTRGLGKQTKPTFMLGTVSGGLKKMYPAKSATVIGNHGKRWLLSQRIRFIVTLLHILYLLAYNAAYTQAGFSSD